MHVVPLWGSSWLPGLFGGEDQHEPLSKAEWESQGGGWRGGQIPEPCISSGKYTQTDCFLLSILDLFQSNLLLCSASLQ